MWIYAGIVAAVGLAGVLLSRVGSGKSAVPIPPSAQKMHLLRKGSAGPEVSVWRTVVGIPAGVDFDNETVAATKAWQSAQGLTADGLVGLDSWTRAGYGFESGPATSNGLPRPKPADASDATNALAGTPSESTTGGGTGGHAWAKALPLEATMAQGAILNAFRAGQYLVQWVPLTLQGNGHTLVLQVMARALRIGTPEDSVAVEATYGTEQVIADALDAYLLTPHVADAIFHAADLKILPYPNRNSWVTDGTMGHTDRMVQHSDDMDAKGVLSGNLVVNEGKHWVISKRIWTDPAPKNEHGPNYGFFDAQGVPVQHVGMAHGRHTDYSQLVVLMKRKAMLDGSEVDLADIAADPALASLISDEGTLPAMRHPNWQNL